MVEKKKSRNKYHSNQWHEKFNRLLNYLQKHNNCLVPSSYDPDPSLARWVRRQRFHHNLFLDGKESPLTPERIELLNSIGFHWDAQEALWQERVVELAAFKRQHGHAAVPCSYPPNQKLGTWVKFQRYQYRRYQEGDYSSFLTKERIAILDKLDFVWKVPSNGIRTSKTKILRRKKIENQAAVASKNEMNVAPVEIPAPGNVERSSSSWSSLNLNEIAWKNAEPANSDTESAHSDFSSSLSKQKLVFEALEKYSFQVNEKDGS